MTCNKVMQCEGCKLTHAPQPRCAETVNNKTKLEFLRCQVVSPYKQGSTTDDKLNSATCSSVLLANPNPKIFSACAPQMNTAGEVQKTTEGHTNLCS